MTEREQIAIKAMSRLFAKWELDPVESARLLGMTDDSWRQVQNGNFAIKLTENQMIRMSCILGIHLSLQVLFSAPMEDRWVSLPNAGPLFSGARPIDAMIKGGFETMLRVRRDLEAQVAG